MEKRYWQPDPKKLRTARQAAGFSDVTQFSKEVGISSKMVYMIEAGYSNLKVWQIVNWADACNCSIESLLSYEPMHFFSKRNSDKVRITA